MTNVLKASVNADLQQAEAHITKLFSPFDGVYEGKVEIRCLHAETNVAVSQNFHFNQLSDAAKYAIDMNTDYNIYVGVNPRSKDTKGAAKAKAIEVCHFQFVDADDSEAVKKIKNSPIKPTFVVETGRNPVQRVHAYWQLEDPSRNIKAWSEQQSILADYFGGDRVIDPPRIMRLAGTVNHPSEKKRARGYTTERTRLIDKARQPVNAAEMWQAFGKAPQQEFEIDTGATRKSEKQIRELLDKCVDGSWWNSMRDLTATLVSQGWSDWQIKGFVSENADGGFDDPEVQAFINQWRSKQDIPDPHNKEGQPLPDKQGEPLEIVWASSLHTVQTECFDFVEDLLTDGGMSVLYGDSNTGKTFFASDLAFHVAQGKEWRSKAVERGGVIYLALEGARGIDHRIIAYLKHNEITENIPFGRVSSTIDLCNSETDATRLIEAITEAADRLSVPVRLIVVDTLSRALAGGNENSPDDMGALVINGDKIRHATGAHVMLIHHTGKNLAAGARGHSLLRAATDTEIEVVADMTAKVSKATVTKQRDMEIIGDYAFTLKTVELGQNDRGKIITSCVVEPSDVPIRSSGDKMSHREAIMLEALTEAVSKHPVNVPGMSQPTVGVSRKDLKPVFAGLAEIEKDGVLNPAISNTLKKLQRRGLVGYDSKLAWKITPKMPDFDSATFGESDAF